ncbi:MAG: SurA N-terminal domain-containing protein [Alphaproteobacteria bacterium]|nr:SurA N-terminal domain-containing protein [Alphaproteobacteria bacterium]
MFLKMVTAIFFIIIFNINNSLSQDENSKIEVISIVAIVNDDPITIMDLNSRIQLIIVSSNLPNNLKTRKSLNGQVIQSLINEKLQSQAAERLGIRVTDQEITNNITFIENNNNMENGKLIEALLMNGVPRPALPTRLKANIILEKLLQQVIRPKVLINNNEIKNEYNNYLSNEGKNEYKFSEITFNFNNLSKNTDIILIAKQIRKKIIEENNFDIMAERINENGTGTYKKSSQWRLKNNIDSKTYDKIKNLKKNDISELLLLNTRVSIIRLDDKRKFLIPDLSKTVEDIFVLSFDLPINKNKTNSLLKEIQNKTISLKSCNEMLALAKVEGNKKGRHIGKVLLKDLPEYFIEKINNIEINQPTAPILAKDGIYVVMICERDNELNQEFALKEMIKANIITRSTNILKERYLLDLNRKALIDIRMQ